MLVSVRCCYKGITRVLYLLSKNVGADDSHVVRTLSGCLEYDLVLAEPLLVNQR